MLQEGTALKEKEAPFPTSEVGDTEQPDSKNVAAWPPCSAIERAMGWVTKATNLAVIVPAAWTTAIVEEFPSAAKVIPAGSAAHDTNPNPCAAVSLMDILP